MAMDGQFFGLIYSPDASKHSDFLGRQAVLRPDGTARENRIFRSILLFEPVPALKQFPNQR